MAAAWIHSSGAAMYVDAWLWRINVQALIAVVDGCFSAARYCDSTGLRLCKGTVQAHASNAAHMGHDGIKSILAAIAL